MSEFRFLYPIEVRYGDLDPQGHLNNARYLTYFEQARIQYFFKLGLFESDLSFMDIGVILAEASVTFHAPVEYGYPVEVGVRTSRLGNKSIRMEQGILHAESGEVLASGYAIVVAYDYHTRRSLPVPDRMRERIANFEGLEA